MILFTALLVAAFGVGLIPVADGIAVWVLVLLAGIFWDVFMAINFTMVQETAGVGPRYSGTALGMVFTLSQVGAFISPPLGNSLAVISSGTPLFFWASLSVLALIVLVFVKETGKKGNRQL